MSEPEPEERIVDRTRGQPDQVHHAGVLVGIPLVYGAGLAVWWLFNLQLHLALGGSSILALGALIDALFLNPPTP